MKKIFYIKEYMKIYRKFYELLTSIATISSTTNKKIDCQKSKNKLLKNEFSSSKISSLLSINSRIKQKNFAIFLNFVCFSVLRKRLIFINIRKKNFR